MVATVGSDPEVPGHADPWQEVTVAADEPGPPPAPPGSRAPRRARGGARRTLVVLLALTVAFVAGAVAAERVDLPVPLREAAPSDVEQDEAMVALLEDVGRTEGVMLAFNDAVAERLADASGEEEVLAIVGRAAASGVGGLEALRPLIVGREGGPAVEDVRDGYLPHLDSWIDYLAAIADEPALLFSRDDQQPFILLINATADAFRLALEDVLAAEPSARVTELADRILDDGFRTDGPEPTL